MQAQAERVNVQKAWAAPVHNTIMKLTWKIYSKNVSFPLIFVSVKTWFIILDAWFDPPSKIWCNSFSFSNCQMYTTIFASSHTLKNYTLRAIKGARIQMQKVPEPIFGCPIVTKQNLKVIQLRNVYFLSTNSIFLLRQTST